MKILHITKKYPAAIGGDSVVVSNLGRLQRSKGHQVTVLTSNCDDILDESNVRKFGLRDTAASLDRITIKRLSSLALLIVKARNVIARDRPDVIHTHSVDMAFAVSFSAHRSRVPIVHTFHIVTFHDKNQSIIKRNTELLLARATNAAAITAPDLYDVLALRNAGLHQATLMPNGIDLEYWKRPSHVSKADPFTFIAVGRLEPQKGLEYLIRAAAILRSRVRHEFKVRIIGEGTLASSLRGLVRALDLQTCVSVEGRKSPVEVRASLEACHVAVFPSLYEAMPITLLEAWAMELPVISTPVGFFSDDCNSELATLVQARSAERLADAMAEHLGNRELRERLSAAGLHKVEEYSWNRIGLEVDNLYGRVVYAGVRGSD